MVNTFFCPFTISKVLEVPKYIGTSKVEPLPMVFTKSTIAMYFFPGGKSLKQSISLNLLVLMVKSVFHVLGKFSLPKVACFTKTGLFASLLSKTVTVTS